MHGVGLDFGYYSLVSPWVGGALIPPFRDRSSLLGGGGGVTTFGNLGTLSVYFA
jgi:hypothetical protein